MVTVVEEARPVAGSGRGSAPRPGRRKVGVPRSLVRSVPLVPAIVLLAIFLLGPVISSFYGSFTDASLTGSAAQGASFIGFANYAELFADPDFPKSIMLT